MKLFISYQELAERLVTAKPTDPPFLALMSYAFFRGKWEAKEVYFNPNNRELLNNSKKEIMYILLKEAGYDAKLAMEIQEKWEKLNQEEYAGYLNEIINKG